MYSKAAHLDELITGIWSLNPLFGVEIMHLVDRTDLFKISNLVHGGKEIVTSLEKTETVYGVYRSQQDRRLSVSKLMA
jgi:hypothetical protein